MFNCLQDQPFNLTSSFQITSTKLLTTVCTAVCWATDYTVKKAIETTLLFLIISFICIETPSVEETFHLTVELGFSFSYCS